MASEKRSLRDAARARRFGLAQVVPDCAQRLALSAELLALAPAAIVAGYLPIRDEADPVELMNVLALAGHAMALPCVEGDSRILLFRRWQAGDPIKLNAFGIGEPENSSDPVTPDVVLVPFLAFDSSGHRLGYGGGYYDRTLARLKEKGHVLAVGIGYAGQEVPALPRDSHDQPLDLVVTEQGIRRFR